jgi:hypothetical protein
MIPKWQPISTAPKDGTNILIFEADEGTVRISRWRDDTIPTGWAGSDRAPSHWLPLPDPPRKSKPAAMNATSSATIESHPG